MTSRVHRVGVGLRERRATMTDIQDAIKKAAHNEVNVEGGVTKDGGAGVEGVLEREKGNVSFGVQGGISEKKGWGVKAFFKKVWS